jgi:hypothetical protein
MNNTGRNLITAFLAGFVITLSGCAVYPAHHDFAYEQRGYGPPPYAPAHGYRTKIHGHNMLYDAHLGVYVLLDLHDHYYHNLVYYKYNKKNWYYRQHDKDKWRKYDKRKLPEGLSRKYQDYERRDRRDRRG